MMDFSPSPDEITCACQLSLPPLVIRGLELFNQGKYFDAHEVLEEAWREEHGAVRELYRGILQISVAYYHLLHGNYIGAVKMFQRSHTWLDPFPDHCCGIDLARFRQDFEQVEAQLERLGPDQLRLFDRAWLKPIQYE